MLPIISAKNVSLNFNIRKGYLAYRSYAPLKKITFDVYRGDCLGVVGRNGAGKSSLLRLIAGIVAPDSGTLTKRFSKCMLLSIGVGFLPGLSGRENAILGSMLFGLKREEALVLVDEIREFSNLGDFFELPLQLYSTGMKARLGFAVASSIQCELYLVDEILSVGDREFKERANDKIQTMLKSGASFIIVSHSIPLIEVLCNKLLWVEDGVTKRFGDSSSVLEDFLSS